MNKLFIVFLISVISLPFSILHAQEFQFGVKGGINKTSGGQLRSIQSSAQDLPAADYSAVGEIGYHGGLWGQVNFGKFFVRPEIVYSALESRFDFPGKASLYEVKEFSIPVLIGYNVFGPLDLYVGGAYKNIIDATLEGAEPEPGSTEQPQIVVQNTPFSAQVGAKVEFGSFGIDVRYDYSLSSAEPQSLDIIRSIYQVNRATFEDTRLNQLIVSLTLKLFDTESKGKRRRGGGNCYF